MKFGTFTPAYLTSSAFVARPMMTFVSPIVLSRTNAEDPRASWLDFRLYFENPETPFAPNDLVGAKSGLTTIVLVFFSKLADN